MILALSGGYFCEGEYSFREVLERGERMTRMEVDEETALIASQPEVGNCSESLLIAVLLMLLLS